MWQNDIPGTKVTKSGKNKKLFLQQELSSKMEEYCIYWRETSKLQAWQGIISISFKKSWTRRNMHVM